MTCEAYRELLDRALNGEATQAELENMRQHELSCTACAALHRELSSLQTELASLNDDVPPMPEELHQRWTALVEDSTMEKQTKGIRFRQQLTRFASIAAALVFVIGGTLLTRDELAPRSVTTPKSAEPASYVSVTADSSTPMMARVSGSSNSGMSFYAGNDDYAEYDVAEEMAVMEDGGVVNPSKIIRTASLTLATREYDAAMAQLRASVEQYGGWISYCSESTTSSGLHRATLTLRIPSERMDAFMGVTGDIGRVTSRSESATDVSDSYYDTKTRLATQQALLARLQALITDAADLSDLLELENQIANTQYTIDRLSGSLQATDRQVDYATVDVSLREESPADEIVQTDLTLGQRIVSAFTTGWEAFSDFMADIVLFLAAALPFILVVIVVVLVIRVVRKRSKAHKDQ